MKKEQIEEQVENQEQELQEQVEETQTPTTEELEARIAELEDKNLRMMATSYALDVDTVSCRDHVLYAAPMSHGAGLYNFQFVLFH